MTRSACPPTDPMKTSLITAAIALAALFAAQLLTSCQGLTATASSPYGDVTTANGATTITPKPIVIPAK